jgi:ribosome recycling factor
MNESLKTVKSKMEQAIEHLREDLNHIRTGRANPSILDKVIVDAYGAQMSLREVANVTIPEPRMLLITPFDANTVGPIAKGIERANLGVQPIQEGNVVRITIPPMDQQKRNEMVKLSHSRGEDCKVSIRNARRDANDHARKQKTDGDITEDDLKKIESGIQDLTDKFCKIADDITKEKEKEITTI